jgi:hypothetical protein
MSHTFPCSCQTHTVRAPTEEITSETDNSNSAQLTTLLASFFATLNIFINSQISLYILLTVHFGTVLVSNQFDSLFSVYLFISLLYVFRAIQCSSSGESIVSIHHLVCITLYRWLPGMLVRRDRHNRQYIPDDVLIQLILLMMSTGLLETCREVK